MITHLFMHIIQLLGGYADERSMDQHDRAVARKFQRRKYAHADIPPIATVEPRFDERFKELTHLLVDTDPARLHTRRSSAGRDPERVKMICRQYRLTAWTLLHRLVANDRPERIRTILETELSLWHTDVEEQDASDPESLLARLIAWRQHWDYR
jgi:hypothetical protein